MKKQQRQFFILLIVLIVLAAGFLGLKQYNKIQSEKPEEVDGEIIVKHEQDDIVKITYDYSDATYSFVKEDDTWYYADDHSIDITQYRINSMAGKCAEIIAKQTIENVTDMSQYGLAGDTRTVCFETAGESYIFLVGNYNTISDVYYICKPSDNTVYAVSASTVTAFNNTLEDVTNAPAEETTATETMEPTDEEIEAEEVVESAEEPMEESESQEE